MTCSDRNTPSGRIYPFFYRLTTLGWFLGIRTLKSFSRNCPNLYDPQLLKIKWLNETQFNNSHAYCVVNRNDRTTIEYDIRNGINVLLRTLDTDRCKQNHDFRVPHAYRFKDNIYSVFIFHLVILNVTQMKNKLLLETF